jgi:hypothetical protein
MESSRAASAHGRELEKGLCRSATPDERRGCPSLERESFDRSVIEEILRVFVSIELPVMLAK